MIDTFSFELTSELFSKMSKRPSTYHRKYRKLRKEVDRWLCSDDPAVAFDLQSDNDERGRSRDDGHCISQEISGVEMQLHSAAEMSEGLSASLELREATGNSPVVGHSIHLF